MPAAVPIVAGALGVSTAIATVIVVGAAVVGTVVAAKAIGSALSGALSPDIPDYSGAQGSASDQARGVLLTKRGTNVDIPVIYGYRRVGGRIIFADTNGTDNKYLYVVYAISEGEISKVKRIFVDDAELPNQDPAFETRHTVPSGRFKGRLEFQLFAGTETQGQSALANEAKSWPNKQRKLPGVAYAVFRFEWKKIETQEDADNNPYSGGIPSVQFELQGKKVYKVRNHGSGEDLSAAYASLTKEYSNNPADHLLDFLLNPRFGCGLDITEIDASFFKTSARKLQQRIDYDENGTQDGPFMTGATVLNTNSRLMDNVKILVQGCRGYLPYSRGRYKLRIDDGGNDTDVTSSVVNTVYDVQEKDMMYGMNLIGEQKTQKYNQVIVKYIDPDQNFTEQQVSFTVASDVTADGEDLIGEFFYQTVSNPRIAENIARTIYKNSRNQRYIGFTATPELLEAEVGDIITITSTVFNITAQTFKIQKMTINSDGTVGIEAREHTAATYPFVPGATIEIPAQVFKPSEFALIPVQQTPPAVPLSVRQPAQDTTLQISSVGDHEDATTTVSLTQNDTLPTSSDSGAVTGATQFIDYTGFGTVSTSAITGFGETDIHTAFNNFSATTLSDNLSIDVSFAVNNPVDTTLEAVRIEFWSKKNKSLSHTNTYAFRRDNNKPTSMTVTVDEDKYLRFKFVNFTSGKEFNDASTGAYSAFTYTNLEGQSDSGKDLEAIINNQLQALSFVSDPDQVTTTHQLG